ncbi:MAG: hypothetical protein MR290_03060 [Ruminococcus sp.]|nr:hypothetical protein [Ruminococcus sp.]
MARFLTQFNRKYTVLNHIGFGFAHLMGQEASAEYFDNLFLVTCPKTPQTQ